MINLGVIGCGKIAKYHIRRFQECPEIKIAALCDINPAALDDVGNAQKIPKDKQYVDYSDLIADQDVHAVLISTPNDCHYDMAIECVEAKKPFILEKPVTMNLVEAKKLKDIIEGSHVAHAVHFTYRYQSVVRYVRDMIRNGEIGKIFHVYAQYFQGWGVDPNLPMRWRLKKEKAGSGALGDLGIHMIDLARFMVGEIDEVCSASDTFIRNRKWPDGRPDEVDVDDSFHFLARIGDISATFAISRYGYGRGNYHRIEIYGSKGAIIYGLEQQPPGNKDSLHVCIGDTYAKANLFSEITKIPDIYTRTFHQDFVNSINGFNDPLSPNIHDGYMSQVVVDGLLRSVETRAWVKLN